MSAETKDKPNYLDGKIFRGELKRRMERVGHPNQPQARFVLQEVIDAVEAAMLEQEKQPNPNPLPAS